MTSRLYSSDILEHAKAPEGAGSLDSPTHQARVDNPLCGDRIDLQAQVEGTIIVAVAHRTRGCALCIASASKLTRQVVGLTVSRALEHAAAARLDIERARSGASVAFETLDPAFAPLADAPARAACVALPWDALSAALSACSACARGRPP